MFYKKLSLDYQLEMSLKRLIYFSLKANQEPNLSSTSIDPILVLYTTMYTLNS